MATTGVATGQQALAAQNNAQACFFLEYQTQKTLTINGQQHTFEITHGDIDTQSIHVVSSGQRATISEGQTAQIGGLSVTAQDIFISNIPEFTASANVCVDGQIDSGSPQQRYIDANDCSADGTCFVNALQARSLSNNLTGESFVCTDAQGNLFHSGQPCRTGGSDKIQPRTIWVVNDEGKIITVKDLNENKTSSFGFIVLSTPAPGVAELIVSRLPGDGLGYASSFYNVTQGDLVKFEGVRFFVDNIHTFPETDDIFVQISVLNRLP